MLWSGAKLPLTQGELAAAVMGMRKFEHILRFKPFILRTDSKCIEYLNSLKETRGIYARWLNFMQGFTYEVVHRPGGTNQNADAISRMEDLPETLEDAGEEERLDLEEDVYVCTGGQSGRGVDSGQPVTAAAGRPGPGPSYSLGRRWAATGLKRATGRSPRPADVPRSVRAAADRCTPGARLRGRGARAGVLAEQIF